MYRVSGSRTKWWIMLAIAVAIAVACGWIIASSTWYGIAYLDTSEGRAFKRAAAVAFLDALRAIYLTVLFIVLPGAAVSLAVVAVRSRGRMRENSIRAWRECAVTARLLLCSLSLGASTMLLEAGAAIWQAWLHRSPQLSTVAQRDNASHYSDDVKGDDRTPRLTHCVFDAEKHPGQRALAR